ncbi:hypothetical protein HHI36_024031 [Cryptolaemus montrouzieri]|uniref:Uncharacterized protein n=1 Tax=Cryptolaemus montrouzieri TaxID=559131 RepID=A0ABD2N1U9_9CUCU
MLTMEWPSKNVSRGGILHPRKVQYNPQTKDYLKMLVNESKMAMTQLRKSEYNLRDYEPIATSRKNSRKKLPKVVIRPGSSKRRSYDSIVKSGALERELFVPKPTVNREAEKMRLQNSMSQGNDGSPKIPDEKSLPRKPLKYKPSNRFDQLVQEIRIEKNGLRKWTNLVKLRNIRT